jgi:hypothetical protein
MYLYVRADREERGEGRNLNGIFITGKTRGNFKFLLNLHHGGPLQSPPSLLIREPQIGRDELQ